MVAGPGAVDRGAGAGLSAGGAAAAGPAAAGLAAGLAAAGHTAAGLAAGCAVVAGGTGGLEAGPAAGGLAAGGAAAAGLAAAGLAAGGAAAAGHTGWFPAGGPAAGGAVAGGWAARGAAGAGHGVRGGRKAGFCAQVSFSEYGASLHSGPFIPWSSEDWANEQHLSLLLFTLCPAVLGEFSRRKSFFFKCRESSGSKCLICSLIENNLGASVRDKRKMIKS